jgi:uncharacterized protein (DUF1330 family)
MPALLILNYDVLDEEGLLAYRRAASPVIRGPGRGELVASTAETVHLPAEGPSQGTHTVILRFDSVEAARRTYDSEAYRPLLEERLRVTKPRFGLIVPTVEA